MPVIKSDIRPDGSITVDLITGVPINSAALKEFEKFARDFGATEVSAEKNPERARAVFAPDQLLKAMELRAALSIFTDPPVTR